MAKKQIMIVEDESIVAEDIKMSLQGMGYKVPAVVSRGEEAIKKATKFRPDLVLMDIVLQGEMNGIDVAGQIRAKLNIPVIYLTAYADDDTLSRAKVTEPFGYLIKPFEDRELYSVIETALYKHGMEKKVKESQEWLSTVLKSIGDAMIATDMDGRIMFINPVAEKLTGWKQEEAKGKTIEEVFNIINEETGERAESPVKKVLRERTVVGLTDQTILIARDGAKRPIDDSGAPIRDEKGNITGVVLVFRDITEHKKLQEMIINAKKEWEETFDIINEAITVHDSDFNIIRANKAAETMLGKSFKTLLSQKCYLSYHGTTCPPEGCPSCQTLKTGIPSTTELFEPNLNKYIEIKALPRFDKDNNIIGVVHIVRDFTKRHKLEEELRSLSLTDELTGLYNRRGFLTLSSQQLKIANRLNKGVLMLYADLDGMKWINDKFGHKEGDRALIETANILKQVFRESDI
ncbi:MAG TPA: PAS domain S-box protein, partial [Nitrospirae bacterium]|nr:PAS domain S-box protein [Nitrospirota bacterium]